MKNKDVILLLRTLHLNLWFKGLLALVVHFAFSEIGILFAIPHGFASSIWPAAGITLGLYLAWGWPVIIGAFFGYLLAMYNVNLPVIEQSLTVPALFALASCAQFVVTKHLIRQFVTTPVKINSLYQALKFLLIIGPVSCLTASLLATFVLTQLNNFSLAEMFFTWAVWWVGDFTGVLFFAPIVLCLVKNDYIAQPKRAITLVATSITIFLVVSLLFSFSRDKYHNEKQLEFDKLSQSYVEKLNRTEISLTQHLRALKGLFDASDNVSRADFERFSREINSGEVTLRALAWLPRVEGNDISSFEAQVRASGFDSFKVKLVTPDGIKEAAISDVETVYPILYTEPLERNYSALGIDVFNHPVAASAVRKAINTGKPAITPLLKLVQQKSKATGIIVYYPVYDTQNRERGQDVIGVVEVVFEMDVVLEELHRDDFERFLTFDVVLGSDNANMVVVGDRNPFALFHNQQTLNWFDADIHMRFASTTAYEKQFVDWTSWIVIIGGSAIGIVALAFIYSLISFHDTLSMQVENKTRALTQTNRQLMEASQAKSLFLANMSHELRTPLNGVIGTLQLVDSASMDTQTRELVNQGLVSSKTLLSVINDILDISKIEAGKVQLEMIPSDVKSLFESTVESMRIRAEDSGLSLELKVDSDFQPYWHIDPTRIKQVLLNLLSNAVKFTSEGQVEVALWQDSEKVCFRVKDTGVGMSDVEMQAIFSRFEQADQSTTRKYGGTGLGMAISKQLLELMGGTIRVRSEKSQGSEFTVEVELTPCNADDIKKEEDINFSPPDLSQHKVLLAEDNPINQKIFLTMLTRTNAECIVANDGVEAVSLYKQNRPDIVFLDIQMPNMDGIEACKAIRELNSHIPIIAVTANVFKEDVVNYLASGFTAHIAKPIDINTLYKELTNFSTL